MSLDALRRAKEMVATPEQIHVIHVTAYPSAVEPSVVWGTYSTDAIRSNLEKALKSR
ncbi:MAG: hypothetical protein R3C03_08965 [Pirellulaceae bacterium]